MGTLKFGFYHSYVKAFSFEGNQGGEHASQGLRLSESVLCKERRNLKQNLSLCVLIKQYSYGCDFLIVTDLSYVPIFYPALYSHYSCLQSAS